MTDMPRTPYDDEIAKAQAKADAARKSANDLAVRARNAAREAKKAIGKVDRIDRKRRDRARYIIGGIYMARMLRQEPDNVRRWLDGAGMSETDKAIVERELAEVLSRSGTSLNEVQISPSGVSA